MADPVPRSSRIPPALLAATLSELPSGGRILARSQAVADALMAEGHDAVSSPIPRDDAGDATTVALLTEEVSHAGQHAERLIADVAATLRPGGLLLASALGRADLEDDGRPRRYTAGTLRQLVEHRGFAVETLSAPGVAGLLRGGGATYDPRRDRSPGLLDAGPQLFVAARAPRSAGERSARFLTSLPRKVVSAATVTRDADERLLIVFDSFRGHWTIPGGIVDADEDPRRAAQRETWEEAGVQVRARELLGVFAASWPDRLVLVYRAQPETSSPVPEPVHTHEVSDARFVSLAPALDLLAPVPAEQVRRCLTSPGHSWTQ